ncbi:hypothetical protein BV326_02948 [Pseudomonas syringae pv. actinidiae]|nr:hypothetical protein BV326_02948 [Pseudomonas syringae pv. actinidiae]
MKKAAGFVNPSEMKSVGADRFFTARKRSALTHSSGLTVATSSALIRMVLPDRSSNS